MKGDMTEAARYLIQALRQADALSVEGGETTQLGQLYDTILTSQTEGDPEALSRIVENTLSFLSGPGWLSRLKRAREQLENQRPGAAVPIAQMLAVPGTARGVPTMSPIHHPPPHRH